LGIDYNKIAEVHGNSCLYLIKDNLEEIKSNIDYLKNIGFEAIKDIFERYPYVFITDNQEFKQKINKLITKIGIDYVNIIENNLELLGELE